MPELGFEPMSAAHDLAMSTHARTNTPVVLEHTLHVRVQVNWTRSQDKPFKKLSLLEA